MDKKNISVEAFAIDMYTYLSITKGIMKSCEIEAGPLGYGCVFQVADVLLDFTFTVNMSMTHINMEETNERIGINCALVIDDDNNYIVLAATNFFNPIETALNRQSLGTLIPKILNKATILATKWLAINGPDITKAEKPAEPAQEYHASESKVYEVFYGYNLEDTTSAGLFASKKLANNAKAVYGLIYPFAHAVEREIKDDIMTVGVKAYADANGDIIRVKLSTDIQPEEVGRGVKYGFSVLTNLPFHGESSEEIIDLAKETARNKILGFILAEMNCEIKIVRK